MGSLRNAAKEMLSRKNMPLILTCRKKTDGGKFSGSEAERIEIIKECLKLNADYVDIELSSGEEILSEIIKGKNKSKVIVSYHNFNEVPKNIPEIYEAIKKQNAI
jgi:3-dehydroquinate dehydratase type I